MPLFTGLVLLEARPPLEGDHGLINGLFHVWLVVLKNLMVDEIQHWSNLPKLVMAWLTVGRQSGIIHKVEVAGQFCEPVASDPATDG